MSHRWDHNYERMNELYFVKRANNFRILRPIDKHGELQQLDDNTREFALHNYIYGNSEH